jgi:glycosyltransferase domain-containing protein
MSNFTLIIPTHNRHHYLKRSISYFKDLNATVIYCDSSAERFKGILSSNMNYIHLPGKNFAAKILDALQVVETPFVSLCADDDFILIDSLHKGCFFLNENEEYKTIVGKYISFKDAFDGNYYQMYQDLPSDINLGHEKNAEVFFRNYYQILWAMFDKKILIKAFQIINKAKFHNDNFIEMVIGGCVCHAGGIKFLKEIWGVREISTQEHWGNRHAPIVNMKIAHVNGDYQKFEKLVDISTVVGYANIVMNNYLSGQATINSSSLKRNVSRLIPSLIKKIVKKTIFFKSSNTEISLDQENNKLLKSITLLLKDDCQSEQ